MVSNYYHMYREILLVFWVLLGIYSPNVLAFNEAVVPAGEVGEFQHGTYPSLGNNTHVGLDIVAPCNSGVYAFADGIVVDIIDEEAPYVTIPVAILSTRIEAGETIDFDVSQVDVPSVTHTGASARVKGKSGNVASFVILPISGWFHTPL